MTSPAMSLFKQLKAAIALATEATFSCNSIVEDFQRFSSIKPLREAILTLVLSTDDMKEL